MQMNAKLIPIRKQDPLEVSLSDEALLAACSTGDPDALATLYDRHVHSVHRFLYRLSHVDEHEVEDMVQEAFLAVYRSAKRYKGDASVRTWIFAIAANLAKTRARSHRRGRLARKEIGMRASTVTHGLESEVAAKEGVQRLAAHSKSCLSPALAFRNVSS